MCSVVAVHLCAWLTEQDPFNKIQGAVVIMKSLESLPQAHGLAEPAVQKVRQCVAWADARPQHTIAFVVILSHACLGQAMFCTTCAFDMLFLSWCSKE